MILLEMYTRFDLTVDEGIKGRLNPSATPAGASASSLMSKINGAIKHTHNTQKRLKPLHYYTA